MDKEMLILELVKSTDQDLGDEELIHLLLEKKVSLNPGADHEKATPGQRAADRVAKFAGSWGFIGSFMGVMFVWIIINILLYTKAFDPYPFILLNLVLSCVAAIQAPLIMMSQNRQEQKDRARSENDYKVNLKSELILSDLHDKIDLLIQNQEQIIKHLNETHEKR